MLLYCIIPFGVWCRFFLPKVAEEFDYPNWTYDQTVKQKLLVIINSWPCIKFPLCYFSTSLIMHGGSRMLPIMARMGMHYSQKCQKLASFSSFSFQSFDHSLTERDTCDNCLHFREVFNFVFVSSQLGGLCGTYSTILGNLLS